MGVVVDRGAVRAASGRVKSCSCDGDNVGTDRWLIGESFWFSVENNLEFLILINSI